MDCNSVVGEESMVERIEYSRLIASDPNPWLRTADAVLLAGLEVVVDPVERGENVTVAAADVKEEKVEEAEDVDEGTLGKLNSAWASFSGESKSE